MEHLVLGIILTEITLRNPLVKDVDKPFICASTYILFLDDPVELQASTDMAEKLGCWEFMEVDASLMWAWSFCFTTHRACIVDVLRVAILRNSLLVIWALERCTFC